MRRSLIFGLLAVANLTVPAEARAPRPPQASAVSRFWAVLNKLGVVLDNVASLSDGGVAKGAVWTYRLSTGERRRVTKGDDFSWPVLAPGKDYGFALRGTQLVRFGMNDGQVAVIADNLKGRLIAVTAAGEVLALLDEGELGRLATISPSGTMNRLPAAKNREDRRRMAALASESRAYSGGIVLDLRRASGSQTGFDVFLVKDGSAADLTSCGDARCGQPSLSPDRDRLLYVRDDSH